MFGTRFNTVFYQFKRSNNTIKPLLFRKNIIGGLDRYTSGDLIINGKLN